jgi:hypothetical protein
MSFINQADVWCGDCGWAICKRLKCEGNAPVDLDDEQTLVEGKQEEALRCSWGRATSL